MNFVFEFLFLKVNWLKILIFFGISFFLVEKLKKDKKFVVIFFSYLFFLMGFSCFNVYLDFFLQYQIAIFNYIIFLEQSFSNYLLNVIENYYYFAIVLTAALESEFMILLLAGKQKGPVLLFCICMFFNLLFNQIFYLLGYFFYKHLKHFAIVKKAKENMVEKIELIEISMFITVLKFLPLPFVKTVGPLICGADENMNYSFFLKYNFFANFLWNFLYISCGYFLAINSVSIIFMVKFVLVFCVNAVVSFLIYYKKK